MSVVDDVQLLAEQRWHNDASTEHAAEVDFSYT